MVRRWRNFSGNDVQQRTLSHFWWRFFLELHLLVQMEREEEAIMQMFHKSSK
jgi:hypothetical protein